MPDVQNIFNTILKASLRQKKYNQIGRLPKFFNALDKISIDQFRLNAWPGYEVKTVLSTQGVFMNIESCTKFVNQESVLKNFQGFMQYNGNPKGFYEDFNSSNLDKDRKTVITSHDSRSYQIDGMSDEFTPETFYFKLRDGTENNMVEYFWKRY